MLGIMADSYTAPAVGGGFDPLSIPWHAVYWAGASGWSHPADGGLVDQLDDMSGNARHATEALTAAQPLFRSSVTALNNKPAIDFISSDRLSASWTAIPQPWSVVVIGHLRATAINLSFLDGDTSSNRCIVGTGTAGFFTFHAGSYVNSTITGDTNSHLLVGYANGATGTLEVDSVPVYGNTSTHTQAGVQLGCNYAVSGGFIQGEIAFVGVYAGNLRSHASWPDFKQWVFDHYAITQAAYLTSPTEIAGLQGWWDASDTATITESAGAVSQWNDKSGNGRHVTQATGTSQPSTGVATLNGKNVLTFDGVADCLAGATTQLVNATTGEWTSFVVVKSTITGGSQTVFSQDSGVAGRVAGFHWINSTNVFSNAFNTAGAAVQENVGSLNTTSTFVLDSVRGATTVELFMNGASNGASATTGTPAAGTGIFRIGAGGAAAAAAFWNGVIGEVIVYSVALSATDRQKIEDYLRRKWQ